MENQETPNIENFKILSDFLKTNFDKIQSRLRMESWFSAGSSCDIMEAGYRPFQDLGMDSFNEFKGTQHECNTTACVAGWSMVSGIKELMPNSEDEHPEDYILSLFGLEYHGSRIARFVFHHYWPDDLSQAIKRIDYVIEHGNTPDDWKSINFDYTL